MAKSEEDNQKETRFGLEILSTWPAVWIFVPVFLGAGYSLMVTPQLRSIANWFFLIAGAPLFAKVVVDDRLAPVARIVSLTLIIAATYGHFRLSEHISGIVAPLPTLPTGSDLKEILGENKDGPAHDKPREPAPKPPMPFPSTPDIEIRLRFDQEYGFELLNASKAALKHSFYSIELFNVDSEPNKDPINGRMPLGVVAPVQGDIAVGESVMPLRLSKRWARENNVKHGDRIVGYLTADCEQCLKARHYYAYLRYSENGGWICETDKPDASNIMAEMMVEAQADKALQYRCEGSPILKAVK